MKKCNFYLKSLLVISSILLFAISFCEHQDRTKTSDKEAGKRASKSDVQELMLESQSELEENITAILKLIREKEEEIRRAELDLKRKADELAEKEKQLQQIETRLKQYRKVTYFILIVGLVLIMVAVIPIYWRQKSKKSPKARTE